MGDFLIFSVIASIVLTVVLNAGLWLAASRKQRSGELGLGHEPPPHSESSPRYQSVPPTPVDPAGDGSGRRSSVRVFFPWKMMLALSVGLTVILNVVAALS